MSSFFWVESMVRDDAQRSLLVDMDMALLRLAQSVGEHPSRVALTGCYHTLLRRWADAWRRRCASAAPAATARPIATR